ncbi:MAG: YigZ family protein [Bacteroidales bacterium]|jgi:uncharacterized YigZ family protein
MIFYKNPVLYRRVLINIAVEYWQSIRIMGSSDTYKTIKSPSQGLYREKGSKFISMAFPVRSESEAKKIISEIKKEHHEARHHPHAWIIGRDGAVWKASDDGEPSGSGGKQILGKIRSFGVIDLVLVVPRYFGGTLLGKSGLANAYKSAAGAALANAEIIEHVIMRKFEIMFPYASMNEVMKIIKTENLVQSDHNFDSDSQCSIKVQARESSAERIREKFCRIEGINIITGPEE